MTIIMHDALIGRATKIAIAALLSAVAILGVALWWMSGSRDAALERAAAAESALVTCTGTNAGEQKTIDDLNKRLAECIGGADDVDAIRSAVDAALDGRIDDIARAAARRSNSLERAYANQSCRALRDLPVCRDVDRQLRDTGQGGGAVQNR